VGVAVSLEERTKHWHVCLSCRKRTACELVHHGDDTTCSQEHSYSYFVTWRQCVYCNDERGTD
jgi:hypothetical protein